MSLRPRRLTPRAPRRPGSLLASAGAWLAALLLLAALAAPASADEVQPAKDDGGEKAAPEKGAEPEEKAPADEPPADEAPADGAPKDQGPPLTEEGRKNAIHGLRSKLRGLARSQRPEEKVQEILKNLEALGALGGEEAGRAAMEAIPNADRAVRDAAFDLIEREHNKSFLKPLVLLLEDKDYRRDPDAKRRVVHALSVVAEPGAIEPLADLIRFDEDPEVVAEAADALAGFASVKVPLRKPAVRRLVDLYESTWNLKESVRTEPKDKILKREAEDRYKVYGRSLRHALQALTEVQLTRPAEWRRWWNSNKKRDKWGRHSVMPDTRRDG